MKRNEIIISMNVCDTEEASVLIDNLTSQELILSATVTAATDSGGSFDDLITSDTEVTLHLHLLEKSLDEVTSQIHMLYNKDTDSFGVSHSPSCFDIF